MEIPENEIHIYETPIDVFIPELKEFESLLSDDELNRAKAFRFDIHRDRFMICRALLRKLISKYTDLPSRNINFSYSQKGKPFLKDSLLRFNISHSVNRAVFAFTKFHEVGVDIEFKKDMNDAHEIARRFFSEIEIEEMMKLKVDEIKTGFFNCWTRKEAFIKCIGEGLSFPLKNFAVSLAPRVKPMLTWIKGSSDEIKNWSLFDIKTDPEYVSSLAVKSIRSKPVRCEF